MFKYLNPKNYVRRAWYLVNQHVLSRAETLTAPSANSVLCRPPIFIIGPPRSGSTLLFQVITDAFSLAYISNRHCQWFGAPAFAEKLYRPLERRPQSDYRSSQGVAEGCHAPSECGAWWYRFFRREPAYVTLKDVDVKKMKAFRRSIAEMGRATGLPLMFKNLYASLRIEPIAWFLPEALYVVIERDWVDNATSILVSRKKALGGYDRWWSIPPPNVDELVGLSPAQQVVGQIRSIHNLVNCDIERLGLEDRTFRIRYEEFCIDVPGTLERFRLFLVKNGINLQQQFEVPQAFDTKRNSELPSALYEEVVAEVGVKRENSERSGV